MNASVRLASMFLVVTVVCCAVSGMGVGCAACYTVHALTER